MSEATMTPTDHGELVEETMNNGAAAQSKESALDAQAIQKTNARSLFWRFDDFQARVGGSRPPPGPGGLLRAPPGPHRCAGPSSRAVEHHGVADGHSDEVVVEPLGQDDVERGHSGPPADRLAELGELDDHRVE
jgi:hypothetical protein